MLSADSRTLSVMTPGIHLVHKPIGPTSFAMLQKHLEDAAPKRVKRPRACHGGTLDPFASGLLLILVGQATKLFDYLHAVPKVYEATVRWGIETDNGDPLGKTVSTGDASSLTPARLDTELAAMRGWHEQIPPATSAKRVDGERAYVKAHRGEDVVMQPVRVYLHEAKWLKHDLPNESRLRIVVRGGYYVRSLARDLGRSLGCRAHLSSLTRTAIGPWRDPGLGEIVEVTGKELMPWAESRAISDQDVGALRAAQQIAFGQVQQGEWRLPKGFPEPQAPIRGFHRGKLTFLLAREANGLRAITELNGGV